MKQKKKQMISKKKRWQSRRRRLNRKRRRKHRKIRKNASSVRKGSDLPKDSIVSVHSCFVESTDNLISTLANSIGKKDKQKS